MVPSSNRVLEEGMVVALEPHIGYWHLQDMVLVTPDGPRLLSPLINTDEDDGDRVGVIPLAARARAPETRYAVFSTYVVLQVMVCWCRGAQPCAPTGEGSGNTNTH